MSLETLNLPSDRIARPVQRNGQATAVEQSRAIAEVQAAVVVAQQCPRDVQAAVTAMRESCGQYTLAQRAFFRYSRGGSNIQGPSVHLARELARVWGNIQYGISELRRDDAEGVSEMQAYAWDIQTNTRMSSIFIVPHVRDTKSGAKALTDLRDVYENNANQGARRVREAIFAVLPPWFIEEAKDLCTQAMTSGGGKPLAQRVADAEKWFVGVGVRLAQLEDKLGRKRAEWEGVDIAQLEVISASLRNGETNIDEEFGSVRVSAAEILKKSDAEIVKTDEVSGENLTETDEKSDVKGIIASVSEPISDELPARVAEKSDEKPAENLDAFEPIRPAQITAMQTLFSKAGITAREDKLAYCVSVADRPLESSKGLTKDEGSRVIDWLVKLTDEGGE
jgi:hypothetical protein